MSNITPFSSDEFELSILPDGDSFRVLAPGLAHALGMRDATRLLESIPGAEKGYTTACTPGGEQRVGYVTEAGFYRALGQRQAARVKDPEIRAQVERFQTWVYTEVLPAIRRTGTYATTPPVPQPDLEEFAREPEDAARHHSCAFCPSPILATAEDLRWAGWRRRGGYWVCPECIGEALA